MREADELDETLARLVGGLDSLLDPRHEAQFDF